MPGVPVGGVMAVAFKRQGQRKWRSGGVGMMMGERKWLASVAHDKGNTSCMLNTIATGGIRW